VIIGADGTHSTIRAATVGDVAARFSGMAAYRALVPHDRVRSAETAVVRNWLGPHQHLVAYPMGRDARYVNLVCVVPEPSWTTEAWNVPGSVTDLRKHFTGWCADLTTLQTPLKSLYSNGHFTTANHSRDGPPRPPPC
jgi:salicylate hydroxylase